MDYYFPDRRAKHYSDLMLTLDNHQVVLVGVLFAPCTIVTLIWLAQRHKNKARSTRADA